MTASSSFVCRHASTSDVPAILPLMAAFNAHEQIVWQPEPMTAALVRLVDEPSLGVVLVAVNAAGTSIVGYGLATFGYDVEFSGPDAFITELFVAPASRRFGIGRLLLDALIAAVQSGGGGAVHLMVRPENTEARTLYESRGFRVVPRLLMTRVLERDPRGPA
jgi:ribosomal protein S18 acetylase RimI-like enzyme